MAEFQIETHDTRDELAIAYPKVHPQLSIDAQIFLFAKQRMAWLKGYHVHMYVGFFAYSVALLKKLKAENLIWIQGERGGSICMCRSRFQCVTFSC